MISISRSSFAPRRFIELRIAQHALSRMVSSSSSSSVECTSDSGVAILRINRPKEMNALNSEVILALREELKRIDFDRTVRAVVLTGSKRAFAAGADIREMADLSFADLRDMDMEKSMLSMKDLRCRKPIVGCVNGFCLGGGLEVAMLCDILIAGDTAQFGQPEINLGIMPGAGGTTRLTTAVGKSLSMQMCLTGDFITAERALAAGLVSEVVPAAEAESRAHDVARKIASQSTVAAQAIKESVLSTFEHASLRAAVDHEHERFRACFASADQSEGMAAFIEKRKPEWKHT